jgi:hypothetical protein
MRHSLPPIAAFTDRATGFFTGAGAALVAVEKLRGAMNSRHSQASTTTTSLKIL